MDALLRLARVIQLSLLSPDLLNSVMPLFVMMGYIQYSDHSRSMKSYILLRSSPCVLSFKIDITRSDDYGVGKVADEFEMSNCRT